MRRHWPVAALLGLVLLAAPAGAGAAAAPPGFYGVTPNDLPSDADMARMDRANVGSMRVMFNWGEVQADPNNYDFTELDRIVTQAAIHRIPLLPFVYGTPNWARNCGGVPPGLCDRVDPLASTAGQTEWPRFVRTLVERYGPNGTLWQATPPTLPPPFPQPPPPPPYHPIVQWQVWNEPNSGTFFQPSPTPAAYHRLLSVTSNAIRGADPGARIVLAGLFAKPPKGQKLTKFLDGLYRAPGAKDLFDAVAVHPYSPTLKGILTQLDDARKVMRKRGDKGGRLVLSELGWGSRKSKKANSLYKGPKGQKQILKTSFKTLTAKRKKYKIDGLYWFSWRDTARGAGGNCGLCESFGLLNNNSAAKPAFGAYLGFTGGAR